MGRKDSGTLVYYESPQEQQNAGPRRCPASKAGGGSDCLYYLLDTKQKWKQFPRATPHTTHPVRGHQACTSSGKGPGEGQDGLLRPQALDSTSDPSLAPHPHSPQPAPSALRAYSSLLTLNRKAWILTVILNLAIREQLRQLRVPSMLPNKRNLAWPPPWRGQGPKPQMRSKLPRRSALTEVPLNA